ncbi:MAG: hypothetical protein ACOC1P_00800 [Minisyncoccales bacterium]
MKNKILIIFVGMFLLVGAFGFVSADYRFENNTGTELMHLYSENGNMSVLGNISTGQFFVGDGRYLTNIDTSSLNLSEVNYWTQDGTDLYYNDGNVGIGTTSPSKTLDVVGEIVASQTLGVGGGITGIPFYINVAEPEFRFRDRDHANTPYSTFYGTDGNLRFIADAGNEVANSYTSFSVDNDEKVRIDNDGNVGIGTTSPEQLLEISKENSGGEGAILNILNPGYNSGSYTEFRMGRKDISNWRIKSIAQTDGGRDYDLIFGERDKDDASWTDYVVFKSSGNVGIGTTEPRGQLDIFGDLNFGIASGGSANIKVFENAGTSNSYRDLTITANNFNIKTATANEGGSSASRLFIEDSSGNVGIGTTSPSEKLQVTGNAIFNGTINTDGNKIINVANGTNAQDAVTKSQLDSVSAGSLGAVTGSGTAGYLSAWNGTTSLNNSPVYTDGTNVGIGTNSPQSKLDVQNGGVNIYLG